MVKKYLVIFLALSTRWLRSEASLSEKKAVFDGEHVLHDDNQHSGYEELLQGGAPGFGQLDADLGDSSVVDPCEHGKSINITAPDHPSIDGRYVMREATLLDGPAWFVQYERVSCEDGGGDSAGGILALQGELLKMTNNVRVPRGIYMIGPMIHCARVLSLIDGV